MGRSQMYADQVRGAPERRSSLRLVAATRDYRVSPFPNLPGSPPPIVLVTAGDQGRLTGGNLYNRHLMDAMAEREIPVVRVPLSGRPYPLAVAGLRSTLSRLRPRLVIVDSIALGGAAPLVPWIQGKLGARVVALMHMLPSDLAPSWKKPLTRYLESRLLRAAEGTVVVSPFLRGRVIASGAAAHRVSVIPPGRDGVVAVPGPINGHASSLFRFLCVANWTPNKGIHLVVEALSRLNPRVHLDVVGEGQDRRYARRVFNLLHQLGVADRVHVYGPLEGAALARRYSSADAFVLPSRSEGFGTVYAEAMSFGLPVIACRIGPLPWLVESACGMLVPEGDVEALSEAMKVVSSHPSVPRRMGEAALQRVLRLPTWQESEERFCGLAEGLLQKGCSRVL